MEGVNIRKCWEAHLTEMRERERNYPNNALLSLPRHRICTQLSSHPMASLLCPASSCPAASLRRTAASPAAPSFASSRHYGTPLTFRVASQSPQALAAAPYGYGSDLLRPIDTQTIIIAAAVVSAVSLSLVLGLKVSSSFFGFLFLQNA